MLVVRYSFFLTLPLSSISGSPRDSESWPFPRKTNDLTQPRKPNQVSNPRSMAIPRDLRAFTAFHRKPKGPQVLPVKTSTILEYDFTDTISASNQLPLGLHLDLPRPLYRAQRTSSILNRGRTVKTLPCAFRDISVKTPHTQLHAQKITV